MTTQDLSRAAFDARKHYSSVRMQQGRVLVDDDWNEAETIAEERDRRATAEIVGPVGSPNDGFKIVNPTTAQGRYDFEISAGSFYLGGHRLELEAAQHYLLQTDFLAVSGEEPTIAADDRWDLVYLETYQQTVSAVEDSELFEVALGGPDSATRVRTMSRVHVLANTPGRDCHDAWEALRADWAVTHRGQINEQHELVRDAALTVTYEPGTDANDLCAPVVQGGYLGAENQAIRVQLVDGTHFTWGFDNASPLYRVLVTAGDTVTLLTEPRDQAHWPLSGDTVEILPWAAVLPNGEKIAERRGHLSLVDSSYDPASNELTLADPLPPGFDEEWRDRADESELEAGGAFYYMRVWQRGSARGGEAAVLFTPGTAKELGHTGIEVTLDGSDLVAGDYWIIAARPATPKRVVPWALEEGRTPHGIRVFVAPLALIRWGRDPDDGIDIVPLEVHDCRERFRPLTRLQGCCTYRVGDGVHSHGDYLSIQQAIQNLPSSGGEICMLPGEYEEQVVIEKRAAITIKGCGGRSILRAPANTTGAVLTIRDSQSITIQSLRVEAPRQLAVFLEGTVAVGDGFEPLQRITLRNLDLLARDEGAVYGRNGREVALLDSRIQAEALPQPLSGTSDIGKWPAVFLGGEELRIEGNVILCDEGDTALETATGGIQIAGGSERVRIVGNHIRQGNGNGITLGEIAYVPASALEKYGTDYGILVAGFVYVAWGVTLGLGEAGCVEIGDDPPPPAGIETDDPLRPISTGDLRDVEIAGNEIERMGSNGIGVAHLFDLYRDQLMIAVDRLTILDNTIRGCIRLEQAMRSEGGNDHVGFAGIALADGEYIRIERNVIDRNGTTPLDPVCGIFVVRCEGIVVDHNRILENGSRGAANATPKPGNRGGIVILNARPRTMTLLLEREGEATRQDGVPAVRVHDNIVVTPIGEALAVRGVGPISVQSNHFTSRGTVLRDLYSLMDAAVGYAGYNYGMMASEGTFSVGYESRRTVRRSVSSRRPSRTEDIEVTTVGTSGVSDAGGMTTGVGIGGFGSLLDVARGAVVTILNQGVSWESRLTQGKMRTTGLTSHWYEESVSGGLPDWQVVGDPEESPETVEGFGGFEIKERLLANGNILFNDNQVVFDVADAGFTLGAASVMLVSKDDVAVVGNQCSCVLTDDYVLFDGFFAGWSVRVVGNRFQETLRRTTRSAGTYARMMNCTNDNQGTHCFWVLGPAALRVSSGNRSLVEWMGQGVCGDQDDSFDA